MSEVFGCPNESEANSNLEVALCLMPAASETLSPIDRFDKTQRSLVVRAWGTRAPGGNGEDPELIRLLLLGLVSSVENYFRQVLCRLLMTCPLSQQMCASTEIKFSAARYHQSLNISLSLLDESVFSSSENIEQETRRLTGISPRSSGSVATALTEFHKVCVIRHATVHSEGYIGAKNIVDLKINSACKMAVSLNVETFERITDICVNLVRAYNSHMWKAIVSRLVSKEILKFDNSDLDRQLFDDLKKTFWSSTRLDHGQEGYCLYDKILESRSLQSSVEENAGSL